MADSLMSLDEVLSKVPVSKTTLYRMMGKKLFPQSVQISSNRRGWYRSQVDSWIDGLRNNKKEEAANG